jgi:putative endonuclease
MTKQPALYILASQPNGTLYTGVTTDLVRRVWEHRSGLVEGFTKRYRVHRLVYFKVHNHIEEAIRREKRIKKWRRAWKVDLIEESNPPNGATSGRRLSATRTWLPAWAGM